MAELLPALRDRRARRAFAARPVEEDVRAVLWEAVAVAPSHGNSQPTRVLVADSGAARDALVAALSGGNRSWAPAAPLLAAVVANPAHDNVQTNSDGSTRELWPFHTGIAVGNLLAQATALGLTAHPMAAFDEPAVRAAFDIPESVRVLTVVAIGYAGAPEQLPEDLRGRETSPQERLSIEQIVGVDAWNGELAVSARERRKRTP